MKRLNRVLASLAWACLLSWQHCSAEEEESLCQPTGVVGDGVSYSFCTQFSLL